MKLRYEKTITTLTLCIIIAAAILLVYGKTYWQSSDTFQMFWNAVWFVALPVMIVISFFVVSKNRHNKDDEDS